MSLFTSYLMVVAMMCQGLPHKEMQECQLALMKCIYAVDVLGCFESSVKESYECSKDKK